MRIINKADELGFCYGVKNAIKITIQVANDNTIPKPIYLLGSLVHNHHVSDYLKSIGIKILEGVSRLAMLDQIDKGTVIFTAHGVSNKVIQKAKDKKLNIIDATCPYVEATFKSMQDKISEGYDLIFIGKHTHPESESALEISNRVHLLDDSLNFISNPKIMLCHQTTMSSFDVEDATSKLKAIYPHISKLDMICKVTEKRQNSIKALAEHTFKNPSLIIVIGDKNSNNSTKLYEMAKRLNKTDVLFIDNIDEIDFLKIKSYQEFFITSGTSTPLAITNELYNILLNIDNIHTSKVKSRLTLEDYVK